MRIRRFRSVALASCALPLALVGTAGAAKSSTTKAAAAPAAAASGSASSASAPNTISPSYGHISAFYGHISAFYGRISPFYGHISPFYSGNLSAFWGDNTPFSPPPSTLSVLFGKDYDPFWGSGASNPYKKPIGGMNYASIGGFWQTETASWNKIETAWSSATTTADATKLSSLIKTTLLDPAWKFWAGPAAVSNLAPAPGTGGSPHQPVKTASAAFSAVFSAAGVRLNADGSPNATDLMALSAEDQALLYLNFYDRMMDFAGTGHVDWWMGAVHWSPALAQTEGTIPDGGTAPTVGMLDFVITSDKKVSKQVTQFGSAENNGHGAAVGSLIMGATDGSGVLGVLPPGDVNVVVYDPYDSTDTTNWTDVGTGIKTLTAAIFKGKTVPVGVLNASLGVSGWTLNPGWNDALAGAGAHGHNLVIAAGNDGTTQTQNVAWNFANNPTLIVVGSVGLDGTISPFSNKPGEACLLDTASSSTSCTEANKLKYHFIVAPGEFILVSDGKGGHVRQSGTSLAAPLVSGAIALLQNRWPWLSKYSDETAQIILKSATPLGTNPGADPVYGVGELNITASQSPLNWNALEYHTVTNGKVSSTATPVSTVLSQVRNTSQSSFDASNLYFTAIEHVGRTYRDFQIPLSSKLVGQKVSTSAGNQLFQTYLASALRAQAAKLVEDAGDTQAVAPLSFQSSDVAASAVPGLGFKVTMSLQNTNAGFRTGNTPYQAAAAFDGQGFGIRFGFGNGAPALDQHAAFGFQSDYDAGRGGASPLLGLASGGAYMSGRIGLSSRVNVSFGVTQRNDLRNLDAFGVIADQNGLGIERYRAQAQQASVDYALSDRFALRAAVTALHENDGLLGTQSLDPADLSGGSVTHGATFGFDYVLPHGLTLSGAGTYASTRSEAGQLTTGDAGLRSASAEIAVAKQQVFGLSDRARLALSVPMHAIGGKLHYANYGVIDRQTGELGILDEAVDPTSGRTPVAAELMYGRLVAKRRGEFSVFGRVDANSDETASGLGIAAGTQFRFVF